MRQRSSPRVKTAMQKTFDRLYRHSVHPREEQKLVLENFTPAAAVGDAEFAADDDVETFLELKGKLHPLRISSLRAVEK
jgi:hypothetical protein